MKVGRKEQVTIMTRWMLQGIGAMALVFAAALWQGCEVDLGGTGNGEDHSATTTAATDTPVVAAAAAEEEDEGEASTGGSSTAPSGNVAGFNPSGSRQIANRDGGGNFVYNPDNSRKSSKVVLPTSWGYSVNGAQIYASDGSHFDALTRAYPNEDDGRPRYYGSKNIGLYPQNITIAYTHEDGTRTHMIIPNPQQRYD